MGIASWGKYTVNLQLTRFPDYKGFQLCLYNSHFMVFMLTVSWLNGELEGKAHHCQIGLVDPPCTPQDGTKGGLQQLLTGYTNDVLHNIYCIRQFDWEQVQLKLWPKHKYLCYLSLNTTVTYTNHTSYTHSQEQYFEEGVEWEMVEVESNDSLRQVFEQVSPTPNTGKGFAYFPRKPGT